jgi:hypothetical protein
MKLFKIVSPEPFGYETYDEAVVAAEDEASARATHPSGDNDCWGEKYFNSWGCSPQEIQVTYLGEAVEGTEAGVIVASFNAG